MPVILSINGVDTDLIVEPRRTLLDTLREDLDLTGAKKVCDMGDCGACTVLLDGDAVYSCLLLAVDCNGHDITTVEGLANDEILSPLQEAFVVCDALQCGYCTPGQLMSLTALFEANPNPSNDDIIHAVTGNLCRCGAYPNIIRAAHRVREQLGGPR